jgi:aminopeptidase N
MTYKKGAWFLHMLREKMGHEPFKMGIKSYYKKYFNGHASTADFIHEMELFTSEDLDPFLNQWLKRPDMLEISTNWSYDESLSQINLTLTQKATSEVLFDVPVEFEVHFTEGIDPVIFRVDMSTRSQTYTIPALIKPQLILADPRTVLLADIRLTEQR